MIAADSTRFLLRSLKARGGVAMESGSMEQKKRPAVETVSFVSPGTPTSAPIPVSKQTSVSAAPPASAANASQIWINVDFATVDQGSVLRIGGWALAPSPIELVHVFVGDQLVGMAETGVLRQDVASTWPNHKHARHSGFTLNADVAAFKQKEIVLKVRAQTAEGVAHEATVAATRAAQDNAPSATEIHELVCDEAVIETSGELTLAGWAVSSSGIRQIRIVSDSKIIGVAELGYDRPDVGRKFPAIAAARKAGFRFNTVLQSKGSRRERAIRVEALLMDGRVRPIEVKATLQDPAKPTAQGMSLVEFDSEALTKKRPLHKEGFIDIYGYHETAGGWLICGWINQISEEESEIGDATVQFEKGKIVGEAFAAKYFRADVAKKGLGIVIFIKAANPPFGRMISVSFKYQGAVARVMSSGSVRVLRDEELADSLKPIIQDAFAGRNLELIVNIISRPPYTGANTLGNLSEKVFLEIDDAVVCGDSGLILIGWMLAKPGAVRDMRVRCGHLSAPFNLDDCIRVDRPDVITALGAANGFDDSRCGFIAFFPNVVIQGPALYIEIETNRREVGFRNVPAAKLDGMAAIKRILDCFSSRFDEVQSAFDVVGPAIELLNKARLSQKPVVTEKAYSAVPSSPRASIIVPLYGRVDFVEYQLAFFSAHPSGADIEYIYVLDDPAKKREAEYLFASAHERFRIPFRALFLDRNVGFGPANNIGLAHARGEYVCFLNSDVFPGTPDWIERLVGRLADDPEIGTVGALLLFEDGSVQHEGIVYTALDEFGGWFFPDHPRKGLRPSEQTGLVDAACITGACMVMKRALLEKLGAFDEVFMIGDFEDSDLCLKIRDAGLRCAVDLDVQLYHLERKSQISPALNWRMNTTLYNAWQHQGRWGAQIAEQSGAKAS